MFASQELNSRLCSVKHFHKDQLIKKYTFTVQNKGGFHIERKRLRLNSGRNNRKGNKVKRLLKCTF